MSENFAGIAVKENFTGEEVIVHLIETARTFLETDIIQAREFFEKGLILSNNIQFKNGSGDCLFELGKISFIQNRIHDTFINLQDAIECFEKAGNLKMYYSCCTYLSEACIGIGNYGQALESQVNALTAAKKINDPDLLGDAFNKTGNIYKVLGEYENSIEKHKQALVVFGKSKDLSGLSMTNFHLGNCYNWSGNLEEALKHLETSLEQADELNDPFLQVKPTGSLASLFTKLGEFDRAIDFFYRSIDYVNITGDILLKADLLRNLGNLYVKTGQFTNALNVLNESLAIVQKIKKGYPLNLIHLGLANAYEQSGDFENSLLHYKQYHDISSQLINEEVALKTRGIQLKYDYEETRKEKELAVKAVTLKDQFIANISHEIRTPLNGVLGMADLLADTNPSPEQMEYINTIKLSANNLIYIIDDILDYSRIQSGERYLEQSEFSIRDLMTEINQICKLRCSEKRINYLTGFDEHIPAIIKGDASILKQVLMNLLGNSIKFTDKGHVKADVKITNISGLKLSLLFTVSDTGQGIPSDKIHTIFDSFSQVEDDYSKTSAGAGLGLAIVKQLVELYGGEISVNSKLGAGTVFKVELPFTLNTPLERKKGPSKNLTGLDTVDLSSMSVLLVEDNKVNQFLAQKLLSRMGLSVIIASSGAEALDLLREMNFNLILMDVQMPEMNGYQLTEIIRSTLPVPQNQIPIIALTAYASVQEKEKAIALGMSDYITKPYSPHELMTAITRQVMQHTDNRISAGSNTDSTVNAKSIRNTTDHLLLLFNNNVEDVLSLLYMLMNQIPVLLNETGDAIQLKNQSATFQSVHKLRSSVNLLKLNGMTNLIAELEEYSRDEKHFDKVPEIFNKIREMCEKATGLLKEEVIRLKKS